MKRLIPLIFLILFGACSSSIELVDTVDIVSEVPNITQDLPSLVLPSKVPTQTPSSEPTILVTPTTTPNPITIEATVYVKDPQIPILNYHRFLPDSYGESTGMKIRLSDFLGHLQQLYDAGYSLISIDDLMDGKYDVPIGRKPLVLSFDDAYFADQLYLDETGNPSELCGIGVLYEFYTTHSDFGFKVAMFANFGDKYYGNVFMNGWWYLGEGWEYALADAITWGIEHGVMPYNHLYLHPKLDLVPNNLIQEQAHSNDVALRKYLAMAHRDDLILSINNYIALPFGIWPASDDGIRALLSYTDPEERPLRAVFEAGYEYDPTFALAAFTDGFDAFHLPRMAGIGATISAVVNAAESLPSAQKCKLVIKDDLTAIGPDVLKESILISISKGECTEGVYIVNGSIFQAEKDQVLEVKINN